VIVIDNASYHFIVLDKASSGQTEKNGTVVWLNSKNVRYSVT